VVAVLLAGWATTGVALGSGVSPTPRPAERAGLRALGCEACIVVADRGGVLWARRPHRSLPNASTTKMATALLVARRADPSETLRVSPGAAATGGGGLDLRAGERYTVRDLLYALLLDSSNDAAVALAEHAARTERAFVAALNRLAARLGARGTRFTSPHGLDAPGHHSTASDLARIAAALLAEPLLADIVATATTTIRGPHGGIFLRNRNLLLERYRGAVGVKTGFTSAAGQVLVAAASRHGRSLIAVAMRSDDAAADCRRLLDYGFARLRRAVLLGAQDLVGKVVFDPAGSVAAAAAATVRGIHDPRLVVVSFRPEPDLHPPIQRGERVGAAVLSASGRVIASVPAVAAEAIPAEAPGGMVEVLGALLRWGHRAAGAFESM
jgi:D-alanyl-D-alanine carboxypeptidase (penicillin-binding protein 5/6)